MYQNMVLIKNDFYNLQITTIILLLMIKIIFIQSQIFNVWEVMLLKQAVKNRANYKKYGCWYFDLFCTKIAQCALFCFCPLPFFTQDCVMCLVISSHIITLYMMCTSLHLPSKHLPFRPYFSFSSPSSYFIALIFSAPQTSNWKDALHKQIPSLFIYGHNAVKMRLQNSFKSVENGVEKLILRRPRHAALILLVEEVQHIKM